MNITTLTPKQLRKAADIQERIQSLQKELTQILGVAETPTESPQVSRNGRGKRRMSAAGRAAIAAALKARWKRAKAAGRKRL